MKKYLYWSFHTGEIYNVLEDEVDTMTAFQLRLKKHPKENCNKCYGRFYEGLNTETELYIPCRKCSKKCIDWEELKPSDENAITLM